MLKSLVIYLYAYDLANPSWLCDGVMHRGEIAALSAAAIHRRVIVIVPPQSVLLLNPSLPKMSRARLLQALHFALEEQLLDEVEALHFAAGTYSAEGTVPVAVVSHEVMRSWCALLQSWHVVPHVMTPLTLALPYQMDEWHAFEDDMITVRTGQYQGFTCDKANYDTYLALASSALTIVPQVELHRDLPHVSQDVAMLNLLQGSYATKQTHFLRGKLSWKVPVYLACAWIGLLFLYPTVSYFILRARLNILHDHMQDFAMQSSSRANSAALHDDTALWTIGKVSQSFAVTPGITMKSFDFKHNEWVLIVRATTPIELADFTNHLKKQGLKVQQAKTDFINGRVNATLRIL